MGGRAQLEEATGGVSLRAMSHAACLLILFLSFLSTTRLDLPPTCCCYRDGLPMFTEPNSHRLEPSKMRNKYYLLSDVLSGFFGHNNTKYEHSTCQSFFYTSYCGTWETVAPQLLSELLSSEAQIMAWQTQAACLHCLLPFYTSLVPRSNCVKAIVARRPQATFLCQDYPMAEV